MFCKKCFKSSHTFSVSAVCANGLFVDIAVLAGSHSEAVEKFLLDLPFTSGKVLHLSISEVF